jgi:tight adherence protein B
MSPDVLRLFILLAVFAAVLLLVEGIVSAIRARRGTSSAINQRLALISRGVSRDEVMLRLRRPASDLIARLPRPLAWLSDKAETALAGAGLRVSIGTLTVGLAILTLVVFLVVLWAMLITGNPINSGRLLLCAAFAAAAGFGLPALVLARLSDRRRKQIAEQFPVALDVFIRGLRAGHPVSSALELVTTEMTDPMGSEFGIVLDEVTYGADLRDALQNMADRCGVEDIQMFVIALSIQGETGGNLAEILENLAYVIRDRQSMMLKVRALSSEGRMTALILTLLPVGSFTGLFILNPSFYLDVADDPAFIPGFGALLLGFAIGIFWIRRLVDLKV